MKICIFGGSGSFGTSMTKKLLDETNYEIIIFNRSEKAQFEHKQKFNNNRIKYVIGDIRDYNRVYEVLDNVDYVILASAMKHIDKCESNPYECIKTNVDGCINVINASVERNVKKLVFLSTDKAANPTTLYGTSKLIVEMYIKCVNNKNTDIITTRYGNVFGSAGSVAYIFENLSKKDESLTVTNPDMTRFFMKMNEAVDLVYTALKKGKHKDLWVFNNKSCTIKELADAFSDKQIILGNRCIEKNDECLLTVNELNHSEIINNYYRINENIKSNKEYKKPLTSDNAKRFTKKEIKDLINDWRSKL